MYICACVYAFVPWLSLRKNKQHAKLPDSCFMFKTW